MQYNELFEVDFKDNLVDEISGINLCGCSNEEIYFLKGYLSKIEKRADAKTREDELVGYVYTNLNALMPKIKNEESKRLVKTLNI